MSITEVVNCIACGRDSQSPIHSGCDLKLLNAIFWHTFGIDTNVWEVGKRMGIGSSLGTADEIIRTVQR